MKHKKGRNAFSALMFVGIIMTCVVATSEYCLAQNTTEANAPIQLWSGESAVPASADIKVLKDTTFHVIKKWEPDVDGYNWLHGVALAWHKGKLYASFGHNKGHENTVTEAARYCVSVDGGQSWSQRPDNGRRNRCRRPGCQPRSFSFKQRHPVGLSGRVSRDTDERSHSGLYPG